MHDFAHILEEAGAAAAGPEQFARLRTALLEELARGARELSRARSGHDAPLTVAIAEGIGVLPVPAALRADPMAAAERAWLLT
ncbi:MAG: hypothetical protein QOF12_1163, partial [Solirubrobacteraceae bacterium]|nr:hypothetical protein [Solirubrobacteraceae bacterium]